MKQHDIFLFPLLLDLLFCSCLRLTQWLNTLRMGIALAVQPLHCMLKSHDEALFCESFDCIIGTVGLVHQFLPRDNAGGGIVIESKKHLEGLQLPWHATEHLNGDLRPFYTFKLLADTHTRLRFGTIAGLCLESCR